MKELVIIWRNSGALATVRSNDAWVICITDKMQGHDVREQHKLKKMKCFFGLIGVITCLAIGLAFAQEFNFGDDSSERANHGECDDISFESPGMTKKILQQTDNITRDATDCRDAFNARQLKLASQ